MSADNWAWCPSCQPRGSGGNYVVPLLREDYEVGIERGEFFVIYTGSCQECGFKKKFKHKEKIVNSPPVTTEGEDDGN